MLKLGAKSSYNIIYPEGEDERILKAASIVSKQKIARIILLGDIESILKKMEKLKLKFNVSIIDPKRAENYEKYAEKLYGLRKRKCLTLNRAYDLIKDRNYFAAMMTYSGDADAVVSGAIDPTPKMLVPGFQIIGTKKGIKKASGATFISINKKVYLLADMAVQENPDEKELAEIAKLSAKTFEKFTEKKARIAMLSYSTHSIKENKMRKATLLAKKMKLNAEGDVQLDAALIKEVAKRKGIRFIDANVLIFPNLYAGNISYKLLERIGKGKAITVIIQGMNKPYNNLSRGCDVEDIVNLTKITVNQIKWQF